MVIRQRPGGGQSSRSGGGGEGGGTGTGIEDVVLAGDGGGPRAGDPRERLLGELARQDLRPVAGPVPGRRRPRRPDHECARMRRSDPGRRSGATPRCTWSRIAREGSGGPRTGAPSGAAEEVLPATSRPARAARSDAARNYAGCTAVGDRAARRERPARVGGPLGPRRRLAPSLQRQRHRAQHQSAGAYDVDVRALTRSARATQPQQSTGAGGGCARGGAAQAGAPGGAAGASATAV